MVEQVVKWKSDIDHSLFDTKEEAEQYDIDAARTKVFWGYARARGMLNPASEWSPQEILNMVWHEREQFQAIFNGCSLEDLFTKGKS